MDTVRHVIDLSNIPNVLVDIAPSNTRQALKKAPACRVSAQPDLLGTIDQASILTITPIIKTVPRPRLVTQDVVRLTVLVL